ncbi:hypothetical protein HDU93_005347 [Gonapodya sp. JEL0774]|nr:hypothetical protein HDU93_005347 [Gonapodya sp. JEL0774]
MSRSLLQNRSQSGSLDPPACEIREGMMMAGSVEDATRVKVFKRSAAKKLIRKRNTVIALAPQGPASSSTDLIPRIQRLTLLERYQVQKLWMERISILSELFSSPRSILATLNNQTSLKLVDHFFSHHATFAEKQFVVLLIAAPPSSLKASPNEVNFADGARNLFTAVSDAEPDQQGRMGAYLKDFLMVNLRRHPTTVVSAIYQRVAREYLHCIRYDHACLPPTVVPDLTLIRTNLEDLITLLIPFIPQVSKTLDGSTVARLSIILATTELRSKIYCCLRANLFNLASHKFGAEVLIGACDLVDDYRE